MRIKITARRNDDHEEDGRQIQIDGLSNSFLKITGPVRPEKPRIYLVCNKNENDQDEDSSNSIFDNGSDEFSDKDGSNLIQTLRNRGSKRLINNNNVGFNIKASCVNIQANGLIEIHQTFQESNSRERNPLELQEEILPKIQEAGFLRLKQCTAREIRRASSRNRIQNNILPDFEQANLEQQNRKARDVQEMTYFDKVAINNFPEVQEIEFLNALECPSSKIQASTCLNGDDNDVQEIQVTECMDIEENGTADLQEMIFFNKEILNSQRKDTPANYRIIDSSGVQETLRLAIQDRNSSRVEELTYLNNIKLKALPEIEDVPEYLDIQDQKSSKVRNTTFRNRTLSQTRKSSRLQALEKNSTDVQEMCNFNNIKQQKTSTELRQAEFLNSQSQEIQSVDFSVGISSRLHVTDEPRTTYINNVKVSTLATIREVDYLNSRDRSSPDLEEIAASNFQRESIPEDLDRQSPQLTYLKNVRLTNIQDLQEPFRNVHGDEQDEIETILPDIQHDIKFRKLQKDTKDTDLLDGNLYIRENKETRDIGQIFVVTQGYGEEERVDIEEVDVEECAPSPIDTIVPEDIFNSVPDEDMPSLLLLRCDFCSKQVPDAEFSHHRYEHTSDTAFRCLSCDKQFRYKSCLKNHIVRHVDKIITRRGYRRTKKDQYRNCEICGQKVHKSSLNRHKQTQHMEVQERHVCKLCNQSFATIWNLKRHFRIHTGEKPFQCYTCYNRFTTKEKLKQHATRHTGLKPFECPICHQHYRTKYTMEIHKRQFCGQRKRIINCEICLREFTTERNYTNHKRVHHAVKLEPDPEGKFTLCGDARDVEKLAVEFDASGLDHKLFECGVCFRQVFTLDKLRRHMVAHSKTYMCLICKIQFRSKTRLDKHFRLHLVPKEDTSL